MRKKKIHSKILDQWLLEIFIEYSNTTDEEGEEDKKKKKDEEKKREEDARLTQKVEEDRLKGSWKNVMQEGLLMPWLKKETIVIEKVTF